jgi:hypothetical protein
LGLSLDQALQIDILSWQVSLLTLLLIELCLEVSCHPLLKLLLEKFGFLLYLQGSLLQAELLGNHVDSNQIIDGQLLLELIAINVFQQLVECLNTALSCLS